MSYNIENIFICLTVPFLIAAIGTERANRKNYLFIVLGFLCCIVSAYLNTFFTVLYHTDSAMAVLEITPVVEETVKLLPLVFYLLVFEADGAEGSNIVFNIAIGFATFENICYLLGNGTDDLWHSVIRGFSTGAMHITCAFVIGYGLKLFRRSSFFQAAGIFGLLCVTITFHAIFNMLMKTDGVILQLGYAVPITAIALILAVKAHMKNFI